MNYDVAKMKKKKLKERDGGTSKGSEFEESS